MLRGAACLVLVCAAALAAICAHPATARADGETSSGDRIVRVAYYEDGDYMAVNEAGDYVGYNIDYLDEIARYADWAYDYVDYPSWKEAFAALEAGEVDLLPSVYRTEGRDKTMLFSDSALCSIYTTLNVRYDDTRFSYEDFGNFSDMRVGVIEGGQDAKAFVEFCEDNGFDAEIVPYEETSALLSALDDGSLDAIAITYLGSNSRFRTIAQFAPENIYVALPLDRTELAQELNAAMNKLALRDPTFSTLLYDQYFGINTDQEPVFTDDEYAYLESAPTLRAAYDASRMPISYTDPETGEFAGVAALLFEDISRTTGLSFEFVPVDLHEEAIDLVKRGEVDVIACIDRDVDRLSNGAVDTTGAYLRNPMTLVVGQNPEGGRIALPAGSPLVSEVLLAHEGAGIQYYSDPKRCFDAVLNGKADLTYADTNVANYLLSEPQYGALSATVVADLTDSISIGVSGKADERLLNILDRCVQYTSSSKTTTWTSQSSLAVHPTSPIDFLRQYPLQIICAIAGVFTLILVLALSLSRSKLRTARRIEQLTFTDPLTGGWTLAHFRSAVSSLFERSRSGDYAILYLDIARFKSFNAAFGYTAGDELLVALDRLIGSSIAENECHARITADEYVVLVRWEGWQRLLERFNELDLRFNELGVLRERSHRLLLRAGACVVKRTERNGLTTQELSAYMDEARYARDSLDEAPASAIALYTADMKQRDVEERALMASAHAALDRGEFVAYYQPKVEVATNRIAGLEALVRWISPERGLVTPDEFIPLFEKNGFIRSIDLHMLRLACTRLEERLAAGLPVVPIACNFSRLHLRDDGFPEAVKAIVDDYEVPIELIELELTESIVMEDLERAVQVCRHLKDLGFRISIDDFGSGYSALGTLQELPIDVLKLDRTFLMNSESGERSMAVLEGVVQIAQKLHVEIIVEGVETAEQTALLLRLDDSIVAQGFLYSRPVPRAESDAQLDADTLAPNMR